MLAPINERQRTWCYEISISGSSHASHATVRAGWPALCIESASFEGRIDQLQRRAVVGTAGLFERALWRGFAINTALYAAIMWLLFAAPFAVRRSRRIKRGLCPKCAYPVGASDVCTECGAVVGRVVADAQQASDVSA